MKVILFMRCTENRVEDDYDGGIVLLQGIAGQYPAVADAIVDTRLVISARHDDFMRLFPVARDEKQSRYFRLVVEEVALEDVPADPNAPPEVYNERGEQVDRDGRVVPGGKRILAVPAAFDAGTGEPR